MNFATMLQQHVTPLSERKPEEKPVKVKVPGQFHANDNRSRRIEAERRYGGMEALSEYQELKPGAKEEADAWASMRMTNI